MEAKTEFSVANAYRYNHAGPVRWVVSHVVRYWWLVIAILVANVVAIGARSQAPILVGQAIDDVLQTGGGRLLIISLSILGLLVFEGVLGLTGNLLAEIIAQKLQLNTRNEMYAALLGKSQTFHDRQRVGDIMARATEDVFQMNVMVNPGLIFILRTVLGFAVPLIAIGFIHWQLLLVPGLFVLFYMANVRHYLGRLGPIIGMERFQFGKMNTTLEESITGIEVVKASAQEDAERAKFTDNATAFRDYFVSQGQAEARYMPLLVFGIALGATFLHAVLLLQQGVLTDVGQIIAVMGLMDLLRFPTFISVWSFTLVELGMKSAERVLEIITAETELDQNTGGHAAPIQGEIIFENVTFHFEDGKPILEGIDLKIAAGDTVAIVGQTGSGKSTLTELVNRTYDASQGRVVIDGVDVRDWNMDSLRSQIARIEQDVFLFSRSLAENIAFGAPDTPQERIEQAAREAQAHEFIMSFKDGYQTEVGDRGVQLSGGQRQRVAIARAFLSDPRILILDDSTSAIDSATEDEIQKAIRRIQQGRTTLLITHRLSQIRWADHILVLDKGRIVAAGTHDRLLRTSEVYRRIFARYDIDLPTLEGQPVLTPDSQAAR